MSYLQFDSTTLCKTPYPLNEIRYRVPFYKISGLGFDLNELDFGKDGVIDGYFGIRTVMLGLPLGVIFSQYDVFPYKKLKKAGAGALSLRVGSKTYSLRLILQPIPMARSSGSQFTATTSREKIFLIRGRASTSHPMRSKKSKRKGPFSTRKMTSSIG